MRIDLLKPKRVPIEVYGYYYNKGSYRVHGNTYYSQNWNKVHVTEQTHPGQEYQDCQDVFVQVMHKDHIVNRYIFSMLHFIDLIAYGSFDFEINGAAE